MTTHKRSHVCMWHYILESQLQLIGRTGNERYGSTIYSIFSSSRKVGFSLSLSWLLQAMLSRLGFLRCCSGVIFLNNFSQSDTIPDSNLLSVFKNMSFLFLYRDLQYTTVLELNTTGTKSTILRNGIKKYLPRSAKSVQQVSKVWYFVTGCKRTIAPEQKSKMPIRFLRKEERKLFLFNTMNLF